MPFPAEVGTVPCEPRLRHPPLDDMLALMHADQQASQVRYECEAVLLRGFPQQAVGPEGRRVLILFLDISPQPQCRTSRCSATTGTGP